ncbi:hypothetical protein SPSIL_021400 [Sporomusa silvacetica DSM 10669]|uniref:DUF4275 domain-containing protein n=1 Tax=Sporomusa silvacetica DSM 10669 TaxID=1123289 RepID=A0ABZ3IJZ2_9FIRM|nr:hypothetical protein [Sporomusa silvacetica]OZC14108.1 hypothetical protein SPSIL_50360 [Sporomusa silvacetica DSM 10669]
MKLDEFTKQLVIVPINESQYLREKYINSFIDVNREYYKKYIETLNEYSDGTCYTGYLWDCLKDVIVTDLQYIESKSCVMNNVFVFWDIHTKERIFYNDYWKFGKKSVLKLGFNTLMNNLEFLPEDVYIFDESFKWTLVITHEFVDDKRWCLKTGNI